MKYNKRNFNLYRAELHIHTVLSPCAAVEMIPPLIIHTAQEKGINLIAITDHNAIGNVKAVLDASIGSLVHVLPGIELQTREEIHSICLFDEFEQLESFFNVIKADFPHLPNNPDFFGEQFLVDEEGDFVAREDRLLSISSKITLKEALELSMQNEGLLIPAHVNRKLFGMLSVLGFIPTDINFPLLEISRQKPPDEIIMQFPQLKNFPLIQSGDAHQLEEIIGVNQLIMHEPSTKEIIKAMNQEDGRSHLNLWNRFPY